MNIPLRIRLVKLCILACLLVIGPAHGAEKSVVIKLATLAPEGSSWMKSFHALNKEVMEKTNNQVQFKVYGGGVLGDEVDMLRKMKIGQIQAAVLSSGSLALLYKEFDVLQIPFLFQKYEEVDFILKKMDSFFRKGLEDNGFILLGWSEGGFIFIMSTGPIASVADLKKAKVWTWGGSPMAKAIFDETVKKGYYDANRWRDFLKEYDVGQSGYYAVISRLTGLGLIKRRKRRYYLSKDFSKFLDNSAHAWDEMVRYWRVKSLFETF